MIKNCKRYSDALSYSVLNDLDINQETEQELGKFFGPLYMLILKRKNICIVYVTCYIEHLFKVCDGFYKHKRPFLNSSIINFIFLKNNYEEKETLVFEFDGKYVNTENYFTDKSKKLEQFVNISSKIYNDIETKYGTCFPINKELITLNEKLFEESGIFLCKMNELSVFIDSGFGFYNKTLETEKDAFYRYTRSSMKQNDYVLYNNVSNFLYHD